MNTQRHLDRRARLNSENKTSRVLSVPPHETPVFSRGGICVRSFLVLKYWYMCPRRSNRAARFNVRFAAAAASIVFTNKRVALRLCGAHSGGRSESRHKATDVASPIRIILNEQTEDSCSVTRNPHFLSGDLCIRFFLCLKISKLVRLREQRVGRFNVRFSTAALVNAFTMIRCSCTRGRTYN